MSINTIYNCLYISRDLLPKNDTKDYVLKYNHTAAKSGPITIPKSRDLAYLLLVLIIITH